MSSPIIKRSIIVAGRKTSISLEDEFWKAMRAIATERNWTLSELATRVNANRQQSNLSSAIRLFVLSYFRDQISEHDNNSRARAILANVVTPTAS